MKHTNIYNIIYIKIICFLLGIMSVPACTKDFGDCFKASGKKTFLERNPGEFTSVRLEDNINLILCKDTVCHVRIECGSGIMEDIRTEISEGRLRIWNSGSCNWVRNLNPEINVYVFYKVLQAIEYSATGMVTTPDTLKGSKLVLNIRDGSGSIKIKLKADTAYFSAHEGVADLELSGVVRAQYIYNNGLGPIDAKNLLSSFTYANNKGTNDIYVNVSEKLEARIEYLGNIYYSGNPDVIVTWINGEGRLLQYLP